MWVSTFLKHWIDAYADFEGPGNLKVGKHKEEMHCSLKMSLKSVLFIFCGSASSAACIDKCDKSTLTFQILVH